MGIRPLNNKAVFLDRDGVINRALVRYGHPYPPPSLDKLEIQPDVPKALNLLKESGFLLIVVTNQPDVGRGIQKKETVEEMHLFLKNQLPLDVIYVCWHGLDGKCECRKYTNHCLSLVVWPHLKRQIVFMKSDPMMD